MPKNGLNVALKGVDEIFSTEESRHAEQREQVQQIPIAELFPFKNHPFRVQDDEEMENAVKSISQYGVLTPLIARPRPEGGYEIISGHRRQHAAQLAGLETVPVIVRDMSDDAATILMVDSNLQRENILPSERAFAYKMKMEAMKHQGAKSQLESSARHSTVSMKMWYCPLFPKCSKLLPSMRSMTEPSLSEWCRKRSPASRRQRSRNSGHALPPQSREFPSWKSCSAKSMRTTF